MVAIVSADYAINYALLASQDIVIDMAKGLADVPRKELASEDGTPRFEFMQSANAEYRERGGKDAESIGAVAHALLNLLDSGIAPPTKVVKFFASRGSATAWRDEDVAMASVAIHSGDDEDEARKALIDYMINEEAASLAKSDWATGRITAIFAAAQKLLTDKFEGGQSHEVLSYDADGIVFNLTRTERDA